MDFSKVKSLTIPEGVVTQIADAAGNVLWSAAEPCTVTIVANGMSPNGNANVTLQGQTYSAKGISVSADGNNPTMIAELTVPSGTVMHCSALVSTAGTTAKGTIVLNGTFVAEGATGVPATYDYVVNGNIRVHLYDSAMLMVSVSQVVITETPVTFTINGTEYSAYPSMTWNDWNNSDFNTTGQKVATVTDASGNSVSLDSLIVGGTAYEVGFAKPMISFTIHEYRSGDRTYQAEEGMTWGEWVDSEYNPERSGDIKLYEVGFDDLIQNNEHSLSVMNSNDWTFPRSTDLIIANGAYELAKD